MALGMTPAEVDKVLKRAAPHIKTLDIQGSDSKDFHDLHVNTIRHIILAAYQDGWAVGWNAKKESDEWKKETVV